MAVFGGVGEGVGKIQMDLFRPYDSPAARDYFDGGNFFPHPSREVDGGRKLGNERHGYDEREGLAARDREEEIRHGRAVAEEEHGPPFGFEVKGVDFRPELVLVAGRAGHGDAERPPGRPFDPPEEGVHGAAQNPGRQVLVRNGQLILVPEKTRFPQRGKDRPSAYPLDGYAGGEEIEDVLLRLAGTPGHKDGEEACFWTFLRGRRRRRTPMGRSVRSRFAPFHSFERAHKGAGLRGGNAAVDSDNPGVEHLLRKFIRGPPRGEFVLDGLHLLRESVVEAEAENGEKGPAETALKVLEVRLEVSRTREMGGGEVDAELFPRDRLDFPGGLGKRSHRLRGQRAFRKVACLSVHVCYCTLHVREFKHNLCEADGASPKCVVKSPLLCYYYYS